MSQLSPRALAMAIQAVEAELRRLDKEIEAAGEDVDPDLQELQLCYELAAGELEEAYVPLTRVNSNMIPYEKLVGRDSRDERS